MSKRNNSYYSYNKKDQKEASCFSHLLQADAGLQGHWEEEKFQKSLEGWIESSEERGLGAPATQESHCEERHNVGKVLWAGRDQARRGVWPDCGRSMRMLGGIRKLQRQVWKRNMAEEPVQSD